MCQLPPLIAGNVPAIRVMKRGQGKRLTAAHKNLVRAILIAQLGSVALPRLKLDGHLLLVEQVGAFEDDAEAALANLLADAVVDAYHVGGCVAARHGAVLSRGGMGGRGRRGVVEESDGSDAGWFWGLCQPANASARP